MYLTTTMCQKICKGVPNLVILFFERSSHLKLEHPDSPWIELKELWERSRKVKLLKSFRSTYWMKFPCIKKSILVLNSHSKGTNNKLHGILYNVFDTHCSTTFSLILQFIFERIVDMNLHERGKGFVERESERKR